MNDLEFRASAHVPRHCAQPPINDLEFSAGVQAPNVFEPEFRLLTVVPFFVPGPTIFDLILVLTALNHLVNSQLKQLTT